MGKYREYGERADSIARAAFKEYGKAKERFDRAKANRQPHLLNGGGISYEKKAEAIKAEAEYNEALKEYESAKQTLHDRSKELNDVRKELAERLQKDYGAKPEAIDANVITLMSAGILTAEEYEGLYNKATADGNHTMARLIGKYAEQASQSAANKNAEAKLRILANAANTNDGRDCLARFDTIQHVYERTVNNDSMINNWGELTASCIDAM